MTPKESTPRVATLRAARKSAGLKRVELYATDEEAKQIRAYAERLKKKREKLK